MSERLLDEHKITLFLVEEGGKRVAEHMSAIFLLTDSSPKENLFHDAAHIGLRKPSAFLVAKEPILLGIETLAHSKLLIQLFLNGLFFHHHHALLVALASNF